MPALGGGGGGGEMGGGTDLSADHCIWRVSVVVNVLRIREALKENDVNLAA